MQSYIIHILRHAVCEGNLEGRYIGRTESPIANEGIRALLSYKGAYKYPSATAFFASPSTRCVDTLKILYPDAEPEVILEMAECDFGDWENKTAAELKDDARFQAWLENTGAAPPNGESGAVFVQRVCAGFELLVRHLMQQKLHESVLVTHGGVIMAVLSAYGLPRAKFYDWMCEPGTGYSLRITPLLWMRSMVLEVFAMQPDGAPQSSQSRKVIDFAREAADRAFGGDV